MRNNRGFTLIELLVLVTVIGILAAVALPNFSTTIKGDREMSQIGALQNALAFARSQSIKSGNATICAGSSAACTTSNWSSGWVVTSTLPNGAATVVRAFPATFGSSLISSGGNLLAFNQAGMVFTNSSFSTPAQSTFALCDSRGPAFGRALNLLPSGGVLVGAKVGYGVDGTTPLVCAPSGTAAGGGGAEGLPALLLLVGLLVGRWLLGRQGNGLRNKRTQEFPVNTQLQHSPAIQNVSAWPCQRGMQGFSLLEVLIALVILSVGLLGIAGLTSTTLKSNGSAYMRTQATVLAYSIIDRMRANLPAVQNENYDTHMPATPAASGSSSCDANACGSSALASYDVAQWEYELAQSLPGGRGSVVTHVTPGATTITVTVLWDDGRANAALGAPAMTTTSFAVSAAL